MSRQLSLRKRSTSMPSNEGNKDSFYREKLINCCNPTCVNNLVEAQGEDNVRKFLTESWKRFLKPVLYLIVFLILAVILIVFLHPKSDVVCFVRVGCFSLSGHWAERPNAANFFPQSPAVINTSFIITSRQDRTGQKDIVTFPSVGQFGVVNEAKIPWNRSSIIIFLIHGFTDRSTTWVRSLKDAFLEQSEDVIVVMVEWKDGASAAGNYYQVVANTRVVAREITLFIRYIQRRFGRKSPKRIHLVGHSLGAQISSYVGKALVNSSYQIYQITALDPAWPMFEGYSPEIRLHKSDARHVLVVHSNIGPLGLGMKDPVGTVDIYLNDGRDQRGCTRFWSGEILKADNDGLPKAVTTLMSLKDKLACSHRRAYSWLNQTLRDLAGGISKYSHHVIESTPVVAYPIKWVNNMDVLELARSRSIQISHCQQQNEHGCWKLERNEEDAFFRLPFLTESNSTPTTNNSFFIPTTTDIPFCVRYTLLEMSTCPSYSSHFSPFLGEPTFENGILKLSQSIFSEEVLIYEGLLHEHPKLHAWVEFPCIKLQRSNYRDSQKFHQNSIKSNRNKNKRYLDVKLIVYLEEFHASRKSNSSGSAKGTKRTPSVCMNNFKLSYFNETEKEILSLKWQAENDVAGEMLMSSNECYLIRFPLESIQLRGFNEYRALK